jgi:hypothetical protein
MTQPGFDFAEPVRPRKRGRVTASSVEAYRERPRDARVGSVVGWLGGYHWQYVHCPSSTTPNYPPTSAELSKWVWKLDERRTPMSTDCLLTVRRGLSDALALGLVSHAGERTCSVSGRKCVTWAVRSR